MTDRELMQMALDALDLVTDLTSYDDEVYEAIDALRARLAQLEPEPLAQMKEMLEVQGRDGTWNYDPYLHGMYNGMEFMVALAERREPVFREPPERWLHTQPQREWQGLTKQEIADETDIATSSNKDIFDLRKAFWCGARWAEEKLKEKNGFA